MPRPKFRNGAIYHVSNSGEGKAPLFRVDVDRLRFLHAMEEFNHAQSVANSGYAFRRPHLRHGPSQPIVEIIAFGLAQTHFHLLLRQVHDHGVSAFMRKIGTAYTLYFNRRYGHDGPLFAGRYEAEEVEREADLRDLFHFIHVEPLAHPNREELFAYRWSSFLDYLGRRNFPFLTNRSLFSELFGDAAQLEEDLLDWLEDFDRI